MTDIIRVPRSNSAAIVMLERFAAIEDQVAGIEAKRNRVIAGANKAADVLLEPLVAEREQIRAKLQPWWAKAGAALTKGARKTVELGGCIVGTKAGRSSLHVDRNEDDVISDLKLISWGKRLLRQRWSLDRGAVTKALDGKRAEDLGKLGLSIDEGEEQFVLKRAEQAGTVTGA